MKVIVLRSILVFDEGNSTEKYPLLFDEGNSTEKYPFI